MNMLDRPVHCVLDARAALGECPVWDAAAQLLYWVDILAPALHCFNPATGDTQHWAFDEPIGSFGLCEHPGHAVLALKSGFFYFDLSSQVLTVVDQPDLPEGVRFNDGKVSPDGCFFAGTMDEGLSQPKGALYRLDPAGRCTRLVDYLIVSNGLAWNLEGNILYHSDSKAQIIYRWQYDRHSGTMSHREIFARSDEAVGRPDGGATDVAGNYWSAGISAGVVNCWAPDGHLLERIHLPVPHPTCICFGGADLKTMYITSLRHTLSAAALARYPLSGGIFALKVASPGVPVARFKGPMELR
jgi:sugar lactone lactonase YvrE